MKWLLLAAAAVAAALFVANNAHAAALARDAAEARTAAPGAAI